MTETLGGFLASSICEDMVRSLQPRSGAALTGASGHPDLRLPTPKVMRNKFLFSLSHRSVVFCHNSLNGLRCTLLP